MNPRLIIATLLNFTLWGTGYIFLGRKRLTGVLLIIAAILITWANRITRNGIVETQDILYALGILAISVALAYDAYRIAYYLEGQDDNSE